MHANSWRGGKKEKEREREPVIISFKTLFRHFWHVWDNYLCSTQKLSLIPLFHAHGRRTPSFWVIGTTRFESVDIICQIWPIRGYTRSWYTAIGCLNKWFRTGSAAPALPSFLPFYFPVRAFSIQRTISERAILKGVWNQLETLNIGSIKCLLEE